MEKVTATKGSIEFGLRRKRKPNRIRRRERNSDQASGFDVPLCSCASEIFTCSYPNEGHDYKIGLYGNEAFDDEWHLDNAIDEFYTGPMPKWLSDEALATHNKKYYVVQESELQESDWLHSLMEIAFLARAERHLLASPPLEINKVVVETKEDYIREAREKLKAENAIFYISYKYKGVSSEGFAGDPKAIVRKTMDGRPGHMTLETSFERM